MRCVKPAPFRTHPVRQIVSKLISEDEAHACHRSNFVPVTGLVHLCERCMLLSKSEKVHKTQKGILIKPSGSSASRDAFYPSADGLGNGQNIAKLSAGMYVQRTLLFSACNARPSESPAPVKQMPFCTISGTKFQYESPWSCQKEDRGLRLPVTALSLVHYISKMTVSSRWRGKSTVLRAYDL